MESRIILDRKGAEKLNIHGDLLFLPNGATEPIRCQSAYLKEQEIKNISFKAYAEAGGKLPKDLTFSNGVKVKTAY